MHIFLLPSSLNHQQWNSVLSPDVEDNAMLTTMGMSIHLTERKIQEWCTGNVKANVLSSARLDYIPKRKHLYQLSGLLSICTHHQ